jgi:hypothetical protein
VEDHSSFIRIDASPKQEACPHAGEADVSPTARSRRGEPHPSRSERTRRTVTENGAPETLYDTVRFYQARVGVARTAKR